MEKKGRTRLWTTHKDLCYLFYNSLWSFSHKFDCYGLTPKKKMNKIVDFIPAGGWLHIQSVYLWRTEKKNNGIVQVGYLNWYSKCNTRSHTFFSVITNAMQLSLLLSAYMNFILCTGFTSVTLFHSISFHLSKYKCNMQFFSPAWLLQLWIFMLIRKTQLLSFLFFCWNAQGEWSVLNFRHVFHFKIRIKCNESYFLCVC